MHILINGLSARLGGGQTYLHHLLRHVPADAHVTLLSSGGFASESLPPQVTLMELPALTNPFRRAWWERTKLETLATQLGCDILFNPACLLPRMRSKKIKTAVTFQNMLPFDMVQRKRYPLFSYRHLRDWLLERALLCAMRRADLVIFISAFARDHIIRVRGVTPKHAVLIPHGLDPMFFPVNGQKSALPDDFPLHGAPYFLYVSFIDFYKSQREMLRVYATLRTQHGVTTKLVLAGTGYARYLKLLQQEIAALGLQHDVLLPGNLPHMALPALYQNASLNLFASTCENCPNILLEIMASGAPALVSNHGPMPEIAGDTVAYFNPNDADDVVQAWRSVLANPAEAARKAALAQTRAAQHRWADVATTTWHAMETVVNAS